MVKSHGKNAPSITTSPSTSDKDRTAIAKGLPRLQRCLLEE
jgi:hypothetical protein